MRTKLFLLLILALIAGGIWYFDLHTYFTAEQIELLIARAGVFGPLVFMLLYLVAILLFLPATVFSVLAGLLFGKVFGSLYVIVAATIAAQIAFSLSRYLGAGAAEKFSGGKLGNLIGKINVQVAQKGFQAFVVMRCLFLPYIPLSYAAGLVEKAKARDFFLATFLTNLVFSPAFVFLGDGITKGPKALILPVVLIVLVLSVPKIVKKFRKKAIPETSAHTPPESK